MRSDTAIGAALIKQARMRAGLSQVQLAERSGKAKVQIGRWETGVVAPSLDTLLELLRACGFDIPLTLQPYEPADDGPLVALQRQSPGARLERMLARAEQEQEQGAALTEPNRGSVLDPRLVLAALQRAGVSFVVIGGLARVIRGSDEVTYGVDICPSLVETNRLRVQAALDELQAELVPARKSRVRKATSQQPAVEFNAIAGQVKIVATPVGVLRGYDALRPGATVEHLGGGLRPSVASTADLITMAAARGLPKDLALVPQLQRILQLEASPARIVELPTPSTELPGPTIEPSGREV